THVHGTRGWCVRMGQRRRTVGAAGSGGANKTGMLRVARRIRRDGKIANEVTFEPLHVIARRADTITIPAVSLPSPARRASSVRRLWTVVVALCFTESARSAETEIPWSERLSRLASATYRQELERQETLTRELAQLPAAPRSQQSLQLG